MKTNATKTAKTVEENKELTSYQKLLVTLDDNVKAYELKLKSLDRAKQIIGDILAVTTGNSIVTENNNEWGHGHFLELFEILSIRHKNFYMPDFLENLSDYLYSWTFTHDESNRNWKTKTLQERGLDEYGIELKETVSEPKVEQPAKSQELDKLAASISEVLQNPLLPVEVYNSILHGTDAIINSSNSADNAKYETSPEHIKAVLKISKS